jgi:hypothetical protein
MATNHPIDQLFREGLGNTEMTPGENTWVKIQSQASKKNKPVTIWQMAAAITILLSVGILAWRDQTIEKRSDFAKAATIEAPSPLSSVALILPEKPVNQEVNKIPVLETQTRITEPEVEETSLSIASIAMNSVELKTRMDFHIGQVENNIPAISFESKNINKINIIYFTQATPGSIDASKRKLAKIIDYAKATTPVDWVGDIRNKKDEFIENVFSLD